VSRRNRGQDSKSDQVTWTCQNCI